MCIRDSVCTLFSYFSLPFISVIYISPSLSNIDTCLLYTSHPVFIYQIVKFCHQAQGLRISLKVIEIFPHLLCQKIFYPLSIEKKARKLALKPLPDCRLPKMAKRGIADIMNQTCTFQDMADILLHLRRKT